MLITKKTKEYEIRSYEADMFGNIRIPALINFLQDMADSHAAEYNIGYDYCSQRNIAWVVSNYHIKIQTMPRWGDAITISTWPSTERKVASSRDFIVTNNKGETLLVASSLWVLIDMATRKPLSLQENIPHFKHLDERVLQTTFPKIPLPEHIQSKENFKTHFNDIDTNKHVNNAVYFQWIIDSLEEDWLKSHSLSEIEVAFKHEAYANENIIVSTETNADNIIQVITASEGKELARVRLQA